MSDKTYNQALAIGTKIEDFEIKSILGIGGFGITYMAWDHVLQCNVAIKEFMPTEFVYRDSDKLQVTPKSESSEKEYKYGLNNFLDEARTLARFNEPNIVRVRRHMQANNTAYLIMDYEEGDSLSNFLKKKKKPLTEDQIKAIIIPILDSLRAVHEKDFLHRDIKPGNIYLRKNGSPVLIDFGSARQALGEHSKSITGIISPGYAPFEQYSPHSKQGPWTDLYAIGATMYRCITNKGEATAQPSESIARIDSIQDGSGDPLQPAVKTGKGKYSQQFLETIDWMLSVYAKDRPQSVKDVLDKLVGTRPTLIDDDKTKPIARKSAATSGAMKPVLISLVIAVVIAAFAGTAWFVFKKVEDPRITRILKLANIDIKAGRYVRPTGRNALERFRSILVFEPENAKAKAGIQKIVAHYLSKAKAHVKNGNITGALLAIKNIKRTDPETKAADNIRTDIGNYYLKKAREAYNNKKAAIATSYVRRALTYLPDSGDAKALQRKIAKLRDSNRGRGSGSIVADAGSQIRRADIAYRNRNYRRALQLYLPLARRGNTRAQYKIGDIYYSGLGSVAKDYYKAFNWYRKAALQGNANAQFSFGIMFALGKGTTKNSRTAEHWFLKSATQNNQYAQAALGILYERRRDYKRALGWYIKAAKQKNTAAYYKIGLFYERGYGLRRNRSRAIYWYRFAAKAGYRKAKDALRRLGVK